MSFDTAKTWKGYEDLMSTSHLGSLLERLGPFFPEPIQFLLPSIALIGERPRLTHLVARTMFFICSFSPEGDTFRITPLSRCHQYYWEFGAYPVVGTDITYETAMFYVTHVNVHDTRLEFVGTDRKAWVQSVRDAFEPGILHSNIG